MAVLRLGNPALWFVRVAIVLAGAGASPAWSGGTGTSWRAPDQQFHQRSGTGSTTGLASATFTCPSLEGVSTSTRDPDGPVLAAFHAI
ncbi:MAG: hypothetical protein ACRENX_11520 [Candidatus Dormibacteria bacterium]